MYCYGLKKNGDIVGFTWFNLKECQSNLHPTAMKENEAYLFDMYIMKPYRGKNVAVYLRYRCMQVLKTLNKDTLYSISEYFNKPAVQFKKKFNAEFLALYLRVKVFNKYNFRWRLK